MMRFTFRKGLRFQQGQVIWTLIRRLVNGNVQLESDLGEILNLPYQELLERWQRNEFVLDSMSLGDANCLYLATPRELSSFHKSDQKKATYRYNYLEEIEKRQVGWSEGEVKNAINAIAKEQKDASPPSVRSVLRWKSRFKSGRSITNLVDRQTKRGRKKDRFICELFEEVIQEVYLDIQKLPITRVVEELESKVNRVNLQNPAELHIKAPAKSTIYRWVKKLEKDIVDNARLGKLTAERIYRSVTGDAEVSHILERVEIDHTPIDLMLIDNVTKLPLGRPWLTLAIDRYSRVIVGFYISFNTPSTTSVLQCLKMAILPKDKWLKKFPEVKNSWPVYGLFKVLVCDNGMELHSKGLTQTCFEMGIDVQFCPSKMPEFKAAIERVFRTINQDLTHQLPGSVFSNIKMRGDYPSEKLAALDISDFVKVLTKWIVDVYHQKHHRGIGTSPMAKWQESSANTLIELPAYPQQLETLTGIPSIRTLFHYGLEVDSLRYNSETLQLIRRKLGGTPKIELKYYEDDVASIHCLDPIENVYFEVPAVKQDYAQGLPRHIHRIIRQNLWQEFQNGYDHTQLLEAKEGIQAIVQEAIRDKRMATRKKAAVVSLIDSEQVITGTMSSLDRARKPIKKTTKKEVKPLPEGLDEALPSFSSNMLGGNYHG